MLFLKLWIILGFFGILFIAWKDTKIIVVGDLLLAFFFSWIGVILVLSKIMKSKKFDDILNIVLVDNSK